MALSYDANIQIYKLSQQAYSAGRVSKQFQMVQAGINDFIKLMNRYGTKLVEKGEKISIILPN